MVFQKVEFGLHCSHNCHRADRQQKKTNETFPFPGETNSTLPTISEHSHQTNYVQITLRPNPLCMCILFLTGRLAHLCRHLLSDMLSLHLVRRTLTHLLPYDPIRSPSTKCASRIYKSKGQFPITFPTKNEFFQFGNLTPNISSGK